MGIIYSKGDVIFIKNVIFKDSKKMDTRVTGHPFLVLDDVNEFDESFRALLMTSRDNDEVEKFRIKRGDTRKPLRKDSFAKLDTVYTFKAEERINCRSKLKWEKTQEILARVEDM